MGQGRLEETKTERPAQAHRMIPDGSLGKKDRLLKSKDFQRVYKKGIAERKDFFVLYSLANSLGHNRLGFSISSRNIRRACMRNRTRRLFKESYRRRKAELKQGFDLVLVVKKEPREKFCYKEADRLLLALAGRAKLLA